jgi:uncharacterized membrane protein YeaQ/YmgE (transglycosylase-associated protein family)
LKNIVIGLVDALIGGWILFLIGIGIYARFSLRRFVIHLWGNSAPAGDQPVQPEQSGIKII